MNNNGNKTINVRIFLFNLSIFEKHDAKGALPCILFNFYLN